MGISQDVIDTDLALQEQVTRGERAAESLGQLRYRACIDGGASYPEYAEAVGVTHHAVRESVARYAVNNGLPLVVGPTTNDRPTRSEAQRRRRQAERECAIPAAVLAAIDAAVVPEPGEEYNCSVTSIPGLDLHQRTLTQRIRIFRNEVRELCGELSRGRYITGDQGLDKNTAIGMLLAAQDQITQLISTLEGTE